MRFITLGLVLVGCGNPVDVDPEVASEVPVNLADDLPDGYPEDVLTVACGEGTLEDEDLDYNYCHARAYVRQPILDVIAAALEPRVAVDYCNSDYTTVKTDVDPDADWSLEIHHIARSDLADIEYDVRWVCGILEEAQGTPTVILCNFGMLEGQALFPYMEGSFALLAVEGETDIVEWQYIENLQAPTTTTQTIEDKSRALYADMQAFLRGEPYPECP